MTPERIDAVLADFRLWLEELARRPVSEPVCPLEPEPAWSWYELAGLFTALRHEVHLQTRSARAMQEQTGAVLAALEETRAQAPDPDTEPTEPPSWLKVLLEVQDSLDAAHREVGRLAESMRAEAPKGAQAAGFWGRLFGRRRAAPAPDSGAGSNARALVEALLSGYAMSRQRIERLLVEHGLEPMSCAGSPFDAETMEVFEVVADPAAAPHTVVAELRRGYRWHGRPFRCALVRVAR